MKLRKSPQRHQFLCKFSRVETPEEQIVKKLNAERIKELRREIEEEQNRMAQYEEDLAALDSDNDEELTEEKLEEMEKQMEEEERREKEKEKEYEEWLKDREERKMALQASLKVATPTSKKAQAASAEAEAAQSPIKTEDEDGTGTPTSGTPGKEQQQKSPLLSILLSKSPSKASEASPKASPSNVPGSPTKASPQQTALSPQLDALIQTAIKGTGAAEKKDEEGSEDDSTLSKLLAMPSQPGKIPDLARLGENKATKEEAEELEVDVEKDNSTALAGDDDEGEATAEGEVTKIQQGVRSLVL